MICGHRIRQAPDSPVCWVEANLALVSCVPAPASPMRRAMRTIWQASASRSRLLRRRPAISLDGFVPQIFAPPASCICTAVPGPRPAALTYGPNLRKPKGRPYVSHGRSCRLLLSRHVPSALVADRCRRRRGAPVSNPGRPVTLCHIPFESAERFSSRCVCADALLE